MSGRNSAPVRLPDGTWRDPQLVRAWRAHDFRAVFLLAGRVGLTPDIIADNTGAQPQPSPSAQWCLELAKLHMALAQVAATALNSDGREWMKSPTVSSAAPVPPRTRSAGPETRKARNVGYRTY